jgi:hypothetical protein
MPDDKRPKPTIDINAGYGTRPSLSVGQAGPARDPSLPKPPRSGYGLPGAILAGLFGGIVAAGGFYLALKQYIPGVSLTDPHMQRQIKELHDRTIALESAVRQARPAPAGGFPAASQGPEGMNEIRSRLDGMVNAGRDLDRAMQALAEKMQALESQTGGGGASKNDVRGEIAAQTAPLGQRLASAERELEALIRAQNERQSDSRTAALTLALTNLKRAISDGRPFAGELAAAETLSAAKLPISQLSPYKDAGFASLSELQAEFANASQKTIEKYHGSKSNGFMGEVLSRAKSAIQIRPADSTGSAVEAILGRMSTALKSSDLKGALFEGAALEDPPQEMKDWLGKAQARAAADDAVRRTDQELLAALTKATGRRQ